MDSQQASHTWRENPLSFRRTKALRNDMKFITTKQKKSFYDSITLNYSKITR